MEDGSSRRAFLGVGAACAAPFLLRVPGGGHAGRTGPPGQRPGGDGVLEQLRVETLRNHRRARANARSRSRVPGEVLRTLGGHIGLFEACLAEHGDDRGVDQALRTRIEREGRDAVVTALAEEYNSFRASLSQTDDVELPGAVDSARVGAAVDLLRQRGVRRSLRLVRAWSEAEATRADRAEGRARPVATGAPQKPGDDIGGPDYDGPHGPYLSCYDLQLLADSLTFTGVLLALLGQVAMAEIAGLAAATISLVQDLACAMTT